MNKKIALFFTAAMLATISLIPKRAAAIDWHYFEDIGIESIWSTCVSSQAAGAYLCGTGTSAQTSVGVSSWTIPGWITQWQIGTVGGNGQFYIQTSTDNWSLGGENMQGNGNPTSFDFYQSSTVIVSSALPYTIQAHGQIYNTKLSLVGLDNGASIYMRINYLLPRQRGQP